MVHRGRRPLRHRQDEAPLLQQRGEGAEGAEHRVPAEREGEGYRPHHHLAEQRPARRPDRHRAGRAHQRAPRQDEALLPATRLHWPPPRPPTVAQQPGRRPPPAHRLHRAHRSPRLQDQLTSNASRRGSAKQKRRPYPSDRAAA